MWTELNARIFADFIDKLNDSHVRYFMLRNYEGLPEINKSKDIDIIIEPGSFKMVEPLLLQSYRDNGMEYQYQCQFQFLHCIHGMSLSRKDGIHIDLIEGYNFKGYEVFTFEELYSHVKMYKNFYVLDDFFNGVMIYVYKQFGYGKPKLKDAYKETIYQTCVNFPEFKDLLSRLTNKEFANETCKLIEKQDFKVLLTHAHELTKYLRRYSFRKSPPLRL